MTNKNIMAEVWNAPGKLQSERSGRTYPGLRPRHQFRAVALVWLLLGPAGRLASPQAAPPPQRKSVEEEDREFWRKPPMQLVREYIEAGPPFNLRAVHRLIYLDARAALPAVKSAFGRATERDEKLFLAAAVVSLSEPDPRYYEYLAGEAEAAITSNLPLPTVIPKKGEPRQRVPPLRPEFVERAKTLGLDTETATELATREMPAAIMALGESGDRRALPLLLRGLESPNPYIVAFAALGVVRQHDNSVIQPIIKACERLSSEEAEAVAEALFYFDEPEAVGARERFVTDKGLREASIELAKRGWRHVLDSATWREAMP